MGRPKRIAILLLALSVVLVLSAVAGGGALYVWADRKIQHVGALGSYPGRPAAGKGTNWLLVGSDSRRNLTSFSVCVMTLRFRLLTTIDASLSSERGGVSGMGTSAGP